MFSAYDIKKILPRAAFALIAATLSYSLMELVINAVNLLGDSAYSLILGSFPGAESIQLGSASSLSFGALAGTAAAAAGAGLVPIVGVAAAAIFGVLFAFAIVLIRRVILTMMVIIAPIAIVAGIFPGTESLFKKWWDWFFKLLLMYPFVMAMFAVTRVSASIISQTTPDGATGVFYDLAAIALLIAPYFLIGKALSFAGGTIAKVAGFVNNKDKGLVDGLKKKEGERVVDRRGRFKRGTLYGNREGIRGIPGAIINRTGRTLGNPRSSIGGAEQRDARVSAAVQAGASSLEERHKGAAGLTRDQLRLLSSISDDSQAEKAIDALAAELATQNGTSVQQEKAGLQAAYRDAVSKVGGSVNAETQLYSLLKAAGSGHINAEEAAAGVQALVPKLATSAQQRGRLSESLAAQLDGAMGSPFGDVTRELERLSAPAGAPLPPPPTHAQVNDVFSGARALSTEKLGELKAPQLEIISGSKVAQVSDALIGLSTATTLDDQRKHSQALVEHREHILTAQKAARAQGNQQAVTTLTETLRQIDEQIYNAELSGGATAPSLDAVRQDSEANSANRVK